MPSYSKHTAGAFFDRKLVLQEAGVLDLTVTNLIENLTMFSYSEARISGRVTASSSGAGLYYVTIYILTTNGYQVTHGETDESGNYTIAALAPGTYVALAAPLYHNEEYGTNFAARYYGSTTSLSAATKITLAEGAAQANVNIALLTASGGISGRLTRVADGQPLVEHSVYLWSTGVPVVRLGSASSDSGGYYTIRGMAAGTYRAQVWPSNVNPEQWYNGKTNHATADNISIGSSIVGGINFGLPEVVPSPYAPGMRKPLPPVWQVPVVFEWNAIEGARFYELRVDDLTAGTNGVVQQAGIEATNFPCSASFVPGHSYLAQVRAGNSAGYGEYGPPMPLTFLSPPLYPLTVTVNGPGSVNLDPPGGSYASGTAVTLAAVEQDGSTFDHWSNVDTAPGQASAVVTVIAARAVSAYFVANRPPQAPLAVAPTSGVVDVDAGMLQTGAFQDPDLGDTFGASHFLVYQTEGVPIAQSDTNGAPQTTFALAGGGLQGNSTYSWKARFADGHGLWSDWSGPASFSTSNRPPSAPVCVAPAGGEDASLGPLLRATFFSDPDTMDTHSSTLWQIAGAGGDFGSPVYSIQTTGAVYHLVACGVLTYTNYFWRVRYQDSHDGWSGWSAPAAFDAALTVDEIKPQGGGGLVITWPTQTGYLYTLCTATNLVTGPWAQVEGQVDRAGTGALMTYEQPAGTNAFLYYCVMARPNP